VEKSHRFASLFQRINIMGQISEALKKPQWMFYSDNLQSIKRVRSEIADD
jgi:hypothetical protein